ncbi:MAG TPA: alpha/beta fold hydrolase [Calditrichia bacterium]|nr:alpha/beta fold hydrolase [Calditrichota bacterium]HQV31377.1 alpha/beta fold hydrolase [Calditrichia bacterium]
MSTHVYSSQYPGWLIRGMHIYNATLARLFPGFTARLYFKVMLTPRRRKLREQQRAFLRQARQIEIEGHYGKANGFVWGKDGQSVLVAHGWNSCAADFMQLIESLVADGYRVFAFDAPAHGSSPGKISSIIHIRETIRAFTEQFGTPYAIIGHSAGGSAAGFFLSDPALQTRVDKLITIGSPSIPKTLFQETQALFHVPDRVMNKLYRNFESFFKIHIDDFDLNTRAEGLRAGQVMIVHDREDHIVPFETGRKLAESWPKAQFLPTSGIAHFRSIRHPRVIEAVRHFLNEPARIAS